MDLLLGIDLGQTSTKVTAVDPSGVVVGSARIGYPVHHVGPLGVEQDPDDWLTAVGAACAQLWSTVDNGAIRAIGLSSAAHHGVLLDVDERPVRRCVLLTDGRSATQAAALEDAAGEEILARTRNEVTPSWTLAHLRWIAEHDPSAWRSAHKLVFAKDYVRLAVTGVLATDRLDAEGSLLFNACDGEWDQFLAELGGVPMEWLPPVFEPTDVVGETTARGARLLGVRPGIPVVAGTSDTAAESYAAGAARPGEAIVKLATAGNVNVLTDRPVVSRRWLTYTHPLPGLSYHCQATNSAATSLGWWQSLTAAGFDELLAEAAQSPPGSSGVLFHPYLLGERSPVWDPDVRAAFTGVCAASSRGDLTRAVLEGVALSLAECLREFTEHGIAIPRARIVGGGARSALWRQITSDVLGIPLTYPALADAPAGAALLAGAGTGLVPDLVAVPDAMVPLDQHEPDPAAERGYRQLLDVFTDTRRSLAGLRVRLAAIDYRGTEHPH